MRKFDVVYKEKQDRATELFEHEILNSFKNIYGLLLEKYQINDFYNLNEETQISFLTELNTYWVEEEGLTDKGKMFLRTKSDILCESSTTLQKKNVLKNKSITIINEVLRQSNLKWKLYDILDEMYKNIKASDISDILSPNNITDIFKESFQSTLSQFLLNIKKELNSSVNLNEGKKDEDAKVRNRGDVVFSADSKKVTDDKDHFPINSEAQARNALARSNQYKSVPSWYKGSLDELVKSVSNAVHKKYKGIKISEK